MKKNENSVPESGEPFDLLSTVEYGGCSAKLPASRLAELLGGIPIPGDPNVMVDISTHDDAGVYRLNDDTALIVTTDFFPPVCSDPFEFGQIAAANSLSDVYAMGGRPLLALNLNMFPAEKIPLRVLREILLGGQSKIDEAGALTMGGHTIDDFPPKYGLAVVGTVEPSRLVTNRGAKAGQRLILTKPLGTGVIVAARRLGLASDTVYRGALEQMKLLNRVGAEVMRKYGVTGATDITGFGLLGHAVSMADASGTTFRLRAAMLPALAGVRELIAEGCLPGAVFRNREYVRERVELECDTDSRMLALDAQTSGGLLMAVDADKAESALAELKASGVHPRAAVVGEVVPRGDKSVYLVS
ncbi:selenide, water dikinase SelD [uncultured Rikenella sp.]|uniref:selenide, water dikinase SelD n=1 Tax=uncultured Rikenella sp. TaxID=368003 RepID=UPI0026342911|nr:selenide, water dikinase SelD [uncultured Rikenella sp.]